MAKKKLWFWLKVMAIVVIAGIGLGQLLVAVINGVIDVLRAIVFLARNYLAS